MQTDRFAPKTSKDYTRRLTHRANRAIRGTAKRYCSVRLMDKSATLLLDFGQIHPSVRSKLGKF